MALGDHLRELRTRVLISAVGILVGAVVAFAFRHPILSFITRPYCHLPASQKLSSDHRCTLIVSGVLDAFSLSMKIAINVGIIGTCPIWLWQLWRFIAPGLKTKERKFAVNFVFFSTMLFAAGAAVAYLTLPKGLEFLIGFGGNSFTPLIQAKNYISFLLGMVLVFGLAFEFPLVVVMLNMVGLASAQRLRSIRRPMIFAIFAFAAVATPSQDPYTMTAMAIPMCLFYEVALLIARAHDRRVAAAYSESGYGTVGDDEASMIAPATGI